jgi:hypothetical protein
MATIDAWINTKYTTYDTTHDNFLNSIELSNFLAGLGAVGITTSDINTWLS